MCLRLRIALAAMLIWTVPAAAEKPSSTISAIPSLSSIGRPVLAHPQRPSLAFPIVDYANPDGSSPMPRGIIAGQQVAPGTVLGLGIFETTPKTRGHVGDVPLDMAPKRSKRAAIGLSVRF